ncbi:hypothetical protein BC936DRAFT_140989 [Jimgerdemannia flammicorona]|uniref:Uncharacterized protein n=2 Tax=Jimgerdemannia flammicorona TaxID=994334 RepID=A0A433A329_9FUNG|nr:hypothetical protein BC936DRAFT_140989 [Jimgerdemannia flammicorona]RUS18510.1 hypothetical protein BC938DRAFT_475955 [Jimgerdemannia flammicorona]
MNKLKKIASAHSLTASITASNHKEESDDEFENEESDDEDLVAIQKAEDFGEYKDHDQIVVSATPNAFLQGEREHTAAEMVAEAEKRAEEAEAAATKAKIAESTARAALEVPTDARVASTPSARARVAAKRAEKEAIAAANAAKEAAESLHVAKEYRKVIEDAGKSAAVFRAEAVGASSRGEDSNSNHAIEGEMRESNVAEQALEKMAVVTDKTKNFADAAIKAGDAASNYSAEVVKAVGSAPSVHENAGEDAEKKAVATKKTLSKSEVSFYDWLEKPLPEGDKEDTQIVELHKLGVKIAKFINNKDRLLTLMPTHLLSDMNWGTYSLGIRLYVRRQLNENELQSVNKIIKKSDSVFKGVEQLVVDPAESKEGGGSRFGGVGASDLGKRLSLNISSNNGGGGLSRSGTSFSIPPVTKKWRRFLRYFLCYPITVETQNRIAAPGSISQNPIFAEDPKFTVKVSTHSKAILEGVEENFTINCTLAITITKSSHKLELSNIVFARDPQHLTRQERYIPNNFSIKFTSGTSNASFAKPQPQQLANAPKKIKHSSISGAFQWSHVVNDYVALNNPKHELEVHSAEYEWMDVEPTDYSIDIRVQLRRLPNRTKPAVMDILREDHDLVNRVSMKVNIREHGKTTLMPETLRCTWSDEHDAPGLDKSSCIKNCCKFTAGIYDTKHLQSM